jgi:two-component system, OmpR family, alkaline phosphatase synthesis response regulator PhoP
VAAGSAGTDRTREDGNRLSRILVVEDEQLTRRNLARFLTGRGFSVTAVATGEEALQEVKSGAPDLIVLDITLPGKDGLTVCREIREQGLTTPVLFLTAKDQEIDKLTGFGVGADDYLTKPASLLELEARIRVALRRTSADELTGPVESYEWEGVRADFTTHEVVVRGDLVELSAKELELLRFLIQNRGKVVSRQQLLKHVWGYAVGTTSRTIDTHVLNLRRKLADAEGECSFIQTVRGAGYRFTG